MKQNPENNLDAHDASNEYQEYCFISNCSLETQFLKYSDENYFLLQKLVVEQDGNLDRNLLKLQGIWVGILHISNSI